MLDNFREWLSDNLRYILLGLAILIALVVLFFGIKAITGGFSDKKEKEPSKKTEQEKEPGESGKSEEEESEEDDNALAKNAHPEVTALIEEFYAAWGQKDVSKMKELTDAFSKTDETKVTNADYIEEYRNVEVYTKPGLDENTYVVFASYDLKFKDVETPAPGLSVVYVYADEEGKYKIHNDDSDADIEECIEKTRQEADVKELISKVETALNEAMEGDESLRKFEEELGSKVNTAVMADNGDMLTTSEVCNMRSEASSDSDIVDILSKGEQVKKMENADDNWIKVEYQGKEGYIFSDLLQ